MIEGLDGDDRFRMVEDELLFIAGKFTAHLHAAEYQRQKQQVKTRNADTIESISRPVVGRMTPGVRAKQDRLEKTRRRRDGVRRALANGRGSGVDVESEDESPWMGTSLQGLMEEPQGSAMKLSRLTSIGSSTKASARSSQVVQEAEDRAPAKFAERGRLERAMAGNRVDEDNDLDLPIKRSTFPGLSSTPPAVSRPMAQDALSRSHSAAHPSQRQPPRPLNHEESAQDTGMSASRSPRGEETTVPLLSDSDDDLFTSLRRRRQESRLSRGASRRGNSRAAPSSAMSVANTTTEQGHERKTETTSDIIPSFL